MKIAVHDGEFHTDDVMALAILSHVYPDASIERTRDSSRLGACDLRVDVGGKYNPETGDFDHHQRDFCLKRDNGNPYASAGLIWENFGRRVALDEDVWTFVDQRIMQPIDAIDVGVDLMPRDMKLRPYGLDNLINSYAPTWDHVGDYNLQFEQAVNLARGVLDREILHTQAYLRGKGIVLNAINSSNSAPYILLPNPTPPWKELVVGNAPSAKFVVYQHSSGLWRAEAVPVKAGSFELRARMPQAWGGLTDEALASASGVADAKFCHRAGFIAVAESKEGVLRMVEKALEA